MTLREVIGFADKLRPNAFSDADKTIWINEAEGLVQTKVMLLDVSGARQYIYAHEYTAEGVCFPGPGQLKTPAPSGFLTGMLVTITGLADYPENNVPAIIKAVSEDGLTLFFDAGTFAATGGAADAGTAVITGSDAGTQLLARPPHDKLYWRYLCAMIDDGLGEMKKYQNDAAQFRDAFDEYAAWYMRVCHPADGRAVEHGYYLSAYGVAVKSGYTGTIAEWLASLRGPVGPTGAHGRDGVNVESVTLVSGTHAPGTTDVYRILLSDGSYTDVPVYNGDDGLVVESVSMISGTHAPGTTDVYRILYTDGTYTDIPVHNGRDGVNVESVTLVSGTHAAGTTDIYRVLLSDGSYTDVPVYNGDDGLVVESVSMISGTHAPGTTDVYRILYTDGTYTDIPVHNGRDGVNGEDGTDGIDGADGQDGTGVESMTLISGTHAAGTKDLYRLLYTDGSYTDISVYNGTDGTGAGDMLKSVYDTDNDGVVDNAATLGGNPPSAFAPAEAKTTADAALAAAEDINAGLAQLVPDLATQLSNKASITDVEAAIYTHDTSEDAHGDVRAGVAGLDSRVHNLETIIGGGISTNPFSVTFTSLTGLAVTGVWNQGQGRIDF